MTDIVEVPQGIHSSDFPTPADRSAATYNAKVIQWGITTREQSVRDREIAVATHTNSTAAREFAQAADQSRQDAQQAVRDAQQQVQGAAEQRQGAEAAREGAAGFAQAAQVAAAAAGAAAGLPSMAGKAGEVLMVSEDEQSAAWQPPPQDPSKLSASGGVATALGYSYLDHGTIAAAGTAQIDVTQAAIHRVQAAGALTLELQGWATDGRSEDVELHCVNFGGKTVTWPAGNWIKSDGSYVAAVGNSGVTWQTAGTDRVLVMRDAGQLHFKVMR